MKEAYYRHQKEAVVMFGNMREEKKIEHNVTAVKNYGKRGRERLRIED